THEPIAATTSLAPTRRRLILSDGRNFDTYQITPFWRKVKSDWDAWNARLLAEEPIVRLIRLSDIQLRRGLTHAHAAVSNVSPRSSQYDGNNVQLAPGLDVPGPTHMQRSASNFSPRSSQKEGTSAHVPGPPEPPGLTHMQRSASNFSPRSSQK